MSFGLYSCWQYGCTSQLASDKQYRLQAQLAHVVSRIEIIFLFFYTIFYVSAIHKSPFDNLFSNLLSCFYARIIFL